MILRSRILLQPILGSSRVQRLTIHTASTESIPQSSTSTPKPSSIDSSSPTSPPSSSSQSQHQALVAARIEARKRQAEVALAASRADAARQHAALVERTRKLNTDQGSDRFIYLTAIALFLATPPLVYFWWQHRAEHMGQKKQAMLEELAERRRVFQESRSGR